MTKYEDIKYVPFDEEPEKEETKSLNNEEEYINDETLLSGDNDDIKPNVEFYKTEE